MEKQEKTVAKAGSDSDSEVEVEVRDSEKRLEVDSDRASSPEVPDDVSERSGSSKNSKKSEKIRIPLPGGSLSSGPGRGGPFVGPSGRVHPFPPPVLMWCPTIGLPPWCPTLFPPGYVLGKCTVRIIFEYCRKP